MITIKSIAWVLKCVIKKSMTSLWFVLRSFGHGRPKTKDLVFQKSGCVCVCVCLYPRSGFNSQPIFKFDMSTDAESPPGGVSENRFEIGVRVKKWFRKNLITQPYFNQFSTSGSYFSADFQVWYITTRTVSTGRCFRTIFWNKNRL